MTFEVAADVSASPADKGSPFVVNDAGGLTGTSITFTAVVSDGSDNDQIFRGNLGGGGTANLGVRTYNESNAGETGANASGIIGNESMIVSFNRDVWIFAIGIAHFNTSDGTLTIQGFTDDPDAHLESPNVSGTANFAYSDGDLNVTGTIDEADDGLRGRIAFGTTSGYLLPANTSLTFVGATATAGNGYALYNMTFALPEPATITLGVIGMTMLMGRPRRAGRL